MISEIQKRYDDVTIEERRLEGEFRLAQQLLTNWKEEGGEKDQAVDAQAESSQD